ncbi:MAG: helix-turn-helix domain-containing protein [Deltaproteobacteria bacterium]|nr:helix-turn-helix domain-containing protein [Deltaproteobacteria bacterium]
MDSSKNRWLTPADVAEQLQLDEATVVELITRGELPAARVGDAWRVDPAVLQRSLRRASSGVPARLPAWARGLAAAAVVAAVLLGGLRLSAQVGLTPASHLVPYEGFLESAGVPVNGLKYLTFCLYPSDTSTSCVWTETMQVNVTAGRFSVLLGGTTSLDTVMNGGGNLFVGVTVDEVASGGGPAGAPVELVGRQVLGAAPFARRGAPGKDFGIDGNASVGGIVNTTQVTSAGRLHLSGGENVYLLAQGGNTYVSNAWGGAGNLNVAGAAAVSGAATVGGTLNVTGAITGPIALGNITERFCVFRNGGSCPTGFVYDEIALEIGSHAHDMCPGDEVAGDSTFSGYGYCSVRIRMCCK